VRDRCNETGVSLCLGGSVKDRFNETGMSLCLRDRVADRRNESGVSSGSKSGTEAPGQRYNV
jgi:hypothetical protein